MALPTFDAAKHHIGLKALGGESYFGFMLDGPWVKEPQRETVGAPDFGGATDVIGQTPSLARWTQDAFEGGMFAYEWGRDDAMFADCTGFMSQPQSRSLISVPPLVQLEAIDPDTFAEWASGDDNPKQMFMVGGSIYVLFNHVLVRYRIDTDAVTNEGISISTDTNIFAEYDPGDGKIWMGVNSDFSGDRPFIRRINTDLSDPSFDASYIGPPGTNNHDMIGGTIFNQHIVTQIGRAIWVGDPPDQIDPAANGVISWTRIGRLPSRWKDSVPYNELLYILCNDGSFKSHVFAFDGESLLPICSMPFSFYGKTITEYAGRLYVGGTGTDVNGAENYAELYEITGSSVRLVRSFSPETRNSILGGVAGEWPRAFDDLVVFEGMLWMCQKGKRLIAYDVTSDGFFGASEIQSNADLNIVKMTTGRGRIWGFGVDDSSDAAHGIYRIAQPADSGSVSAWNPTLVTSDFIYEPGMFKRWSEITIMSRYAPVESLEYSVNSGASWTALSSPVEEATSSKVYFTTFSLAAITPSRLIRFRIKLDEANPESALTYHRELVSFTVAFGMIESGKKAWAFTINASLDIETLDASDLSGSTSEATTQAYTPSDVRTQLWSWYDNKTSLVMRDLDGTEYNVRLEHVREVRPHIAPDAEAHFVCTIVAV